MKNKQIYLRKIRIEDALAYQESSTNEEIRYMTGTPREYTLEEIKTHIKRIIKDTSREDYAIGLNETKEMIGELSILDIDSPNHAAVFRIAMNHTNHTGKGFGTEAMELIIDHVFNDLKLNRLQLEVFSHNVRGIRAYEKVGFVKEGILREALFYEGNYSDEIIMSILKSDLEKG
ncbi:GNAT family N-acetyltransferase [uncultured Vagococcus sp.]|uniref:GNAT family N-acetyltransferase n=1 Tax=uncultured Vagococcus sp. TaxID=189676 RepID=UPI002585D925|nr:GNAT family protein [uncultured Vagococcus sp.]